MSGFCVTHYDGKANIIWAEVPSVIWTDCSPYRGNRVLPEGVIMRKSCRGSGGWLAAKPQCYHVPLEETLIANKGKQQGSPAL